MALFDSTDKKLAELPNVSSKKPISDLLGTNFMLRDIRGMPAKNFGTIPT